MKTVIGNEIHFCRKTIKEFTRAERNEGKIFTEKYDRSVWNVLEAKLNGNIMIKRINVGYFESVLNWSREESISLECEDNV